jgi:hypothetical protein
MLHPTCVVAPPAHPRMPDVCKSDYEEARVISPSSPRGAAALLRLVVQKLLVHLGERGAKLDDDIASLVKKGLPPEIRDALDVVRVIGNNAVHPGQMDPKDLEHGAGVLFELVNAIVEDRIARPAKLAALKGALPAGALAAIEKRDRKQ